MYLIIYRELLVHGFLKVGGTKMGKSTGNAIDPFYQVGKYGVDQFRFYLLGTLPVDGDGEFSVSVFTFK
jgi:methionyl-tRNA synthetase